MSDPMRQGSPSQSRSLLHKKVMTKDLELVGDVFVEDDTLLTIRDGLVHMYVVPKLYIEAIAEKAVMLKITLRELRSYAVK
jgi:hypothetical protein